MELKKVEEIPKKEVKGRSKQYEEIVQQFVESELEQAEVTGFKAKPQTVYQQLLKVCKKVGGVKVVKRGDRIFLMRE